VLEVLLRLTANVESVEEQMLSSSHRGEVIQRVIARIAIPMVYIHPIRNRPVRVLPNVSMQEPAPRVSPVKIVPVVGVTTVGISAIPVPPILSHFRGR
jgi:hypothetical protein